MADEQIYDVVVPPGDTTYRLANGVGVEFPGRMVYLDFAQTDQKIEGRAVCVARIALHPEVAAELAVALAKLAESEPEDG